MSESVNELRRYIIQLQRQISDLETQLKQIRSSFNYHRHYKDSGEPDIFISEPV